ncbi:hypothetical protein C8A01DRAFT_50404 [Parachaetomium inaequale]|uniref:Uncharacterized protein n=1 Tax=Parachaetomium inaequale TaxID=2588326 RepID=A0AAN6P761_9PEZI|nr:hypothetical protein C8A01DRAFT_50404 [Parachaetomium inaequale]
MASTGSMESTTPSPAAAPMDTNSPVSPLLGLDPHGRYWPTLDRASDPQPRKSCLKSAKSAAAAATGRQRLSVRFADDTHCLVLGTVVPPHDSSRPRDQWISELTDEIMADIETVDLKRVDRTKWSRRGARIAHRLLHLADFDPWNPEDLAFRLFFRRAQRHTLCNKRDSPISSRRDRGDHPTLWSLLWPPDPDGVSTCSRQRPDRHRPATFPPPPGQGRRPSSTRPLVGTGTGGVKPVVCSWARRGYQPPVSRPP